jgi:glyoxylase-like metal-dependent hydrolase (beta-lactamase superfamily II)/ferredoxin
MARPDQRHADNVEGDWFADTRCIDCDVARHFAPELIVSDGDGLSVVIRQPGGDDDERALWRAALACPTRSIGTVSRRRPPPGVFPWALTDGISVCGHNSMDSFGAHSYLVERPDGNVLIDSPRYTRALIEPVAGRGGLGHVLLSHQDDVADAGRWAGRFGARVWIHEAEQAAAPYATDLVAGDDPHQPTEVRDGLVARPAPGHTRGSVVYHLEDRYLFTGDTLCFDFRRRELNVFPGATWYSWPVLTETIAALAELRVEWVFAGHGRWGHLGHERYTAQMRRLAHDMRTVRRRDWKDRPPMAE